MICLKCDKETFYTAPKLVEQEYKGRTLWVETPVKVCSHCGWFTVDLDQADTLLQNTKEVYLFDLWWEKNYPHMQEIYGSSTLAMNVVKMIKVIAKQSWMASLQPRACAVCRDSGTVDKVVGGKVWSEKCPDCK